MKTTLPAVFARGEVKGHQDSAPDSRFSPSAQNSSPLGRTASTRKGNPSDGTSTNSRNSSFSRRVITALGRKNNAGDGGSLASHGSLLKTALGRLRRNRQEDEHPLASLPVEIQSQTPTLVKTFVNQINAQLLSEFLCWYLYYDVVQPPLSPHRWYIHIYSPHMEGWIALGSFLASGVDYGWDLTVLHSVCDRLRLNKRVVHSILVRVSDPDQMTWTSIASTLKAAKKDQKLEVEALEDVQSVLQQLRALGSSTTPAPDSGFQDMKRIAVERIKEFLEYVVNPQINALRGSLEEPWGTREEKTRELAYYFELMQRPRQVPLVSYGVFPNSLLETYMSGSGTNSSFEESSLLDQVVAEQCELERTFSASSLKSQTRLLRSQNAVLEKEKQDLVAENERLKVLLTKQWSTGPKYSGDQPLISHNRTDSKDLLLRTTASSPEVLTQMNSTDAPPLPTLETSVANDAALEEYTEVFHVLDKFGWDTPNKPAETSPANPPQGILSNGADVTPTPATATSSGMNRVSFMDLPTPMQETQPVQVHDNSRPRNSLIGHAPTFSNAAAAMYARSEAPQLHGTTLARPQPVQNDASPGEDAYSMSASASAINKAKEAFRKAIGRPAGSELIDDSILWDTKAESNPFEKEKGTFIAGFKHLPSYGAFKRKDEEGRPNIATNF